MTIALNDAEGNAAGTVTGQIAGEGGEGSGTMMGLGRRPGGFAGGSGGHAPVPQAMMWTLTRELVPPAKPREINYEPTTFEAYYYAGNKPGIHIFPGDIVHTWSPDSAGMDKNLKRVALGGNANIGPIYVEGALPGDTLVVHLIKIEPNRKTARQGSRIQQFGVTPAYNLAAEYDQRFNGEYQLDNTTGIAMLTAPTPALKNFKVTMKRRCWAASRLHRQVLRPSPDRTLEFMAEISITTERCRGLRCSFLFFIQARCSASATATPRWRMGR
ncbi:MAG: Acetamidase/Formamidase [Edaphobacter sp.]|nr:Acetamidase/Formamidase [Edaphobacter sp.]